MATFAARRALCVAIAGSQVPWAPRRMLAGWSAITYNDSSNATVRAINHAAKLPTLQPAGAFIKPPAIPPAKTTTRFPVIIVNTMDLASPYGAIHALDATTVGEKCKFQLPNTTCRSNRALPIGPAATARSQDHLRWSVGRDLSINAVRTAR